MKTLLLLLLTCLPLCAATTYPMLSTTTNRTVTGGVTNLSFLNSNSVFTGTARWMGIATLTNTGNIFVGDGSGLTGVGMVTSGGLATNATIYGLTINTGSTNNALTGSRAVVTDANKGIVSSATTATELGFVSGVTSALQTQINAKAATTTLGGYVTNLGGLATNLTATGLTVATGQTNTHLTASSIVTTDANKGIVSGTTTADLATLSANQTFTGTNTFSGSLIASGTNLTGFAQEWIIYNGPPNVLTNVTGGYGSSNLFHTQTIPAGIMGSNGMLGLYYDVRLVNAAGLSAATTTRGFTYHYNEGTNIISRLQFTFAATAATNQFSGANASLILRNTGTMTNNATGINPIEGQPLGGSTTQNGTLQMDTSVSWTLALYGNVGTASTETNEWRNLIIVVKRFP